MIVLGVGLSVVKGGAGYLIMCVVIGLIVSGMMYAKQKSSSEVMFQVNQIDDDRLIRASSVHPVARFQIQQALSGPGV